MMNRLVALTAKTDEMRNRLAGIEQTLSSMNKKMASTAQSMKGLSNQVQDLRQLPFARERHLGERGQPADWQSRAGGRR